MYLTKNRSCARPSNGTGRFFDEAFGREFFAPVLSRPMSTTPSANVRETDAAYIVDLAVPGYGKEDLKVKLVDNMLTISAEKSAENVNEGEKVTRREYHYGSFRRTFSVPENVDGGHIAARYENGILRIELPKIEKEEKSTGREIQVV